MLAFVTFWILDLESMSYIMQTHNNKFFFQEWPLFVLANEGFHCSFIIDFIFGMSFTSDWSTDPVLFSVHPSMNQSNPDETPCQSFHFYMPLLCFEHLLASKNNWICFHLCRKHGTQWESVLIRLCTPMLCNLKRQTACSARNWTVPQNNHRLHDYIRNRNISNFFFLVNRLQ